VAERVAALILQQVARRPARAVRAARAQDRVDLPLVEGAGDVGRLAATAEAEREQRPGRDAARTRGAATGFHGAHAGVVPVVTAGAAGAHGIAPRRKLGGRGAATSHPEPTGRPARRARRRPPLPPLAGWSARWLVRSPATTHRRSGATRAASRTKRSRSAWAAAWSAERAELSPSSPRAAAAAARTLGAAS